jgi:hypothetical protein
MADPEVPLEEAFRPPLAEPEAERDASALPGASIVRLHLVVLLVALAMHGFVTIALQVELFEPGPTLGDELAVTALVGVHALSPYVLVVPVLLGVVPMLVLPGSTEARRAWPPWPAYLALVAWCGGTVAFMVGPAVVVLDHPLGWWALLSILLADCLYAVGTALAVIQGGRALLRRAPLLCMSLLASAVGTVHWAVLTAMLVTWGPPSEDFYVPQIVSIVLPPVLCLTTLVVERRHDVSVFSGVFPWALLGSCIVAWVPTSPWTVVLVPLALGVMIQLAPILVARMADPVSLSLLAVLVAAEVAVLGHAVIAVSDPYVLETYLSTAPKHLLGGAVLLLLVATCLEHAPLLLRRLPRRGLAIAGVLGMGGGLLTFAAAMMVLGQHGMRLSSPSTYEPRFQALHQQIALGGLVMGLGLGLVVLAMVAGRRGTPQ